jgi:cell division protein FtsA
MEEIIDLVYHEIKVSGYENKLMTGIVLTGGGSQIKNLSQLVSFITGKESRIGYPNEHLGNDSKDKVTSPMYSTGVGLVLKGFEKIKNIENDSEVTVSDDSKSESSAESGSFIDRMKRFFEEDIN